MIHRVVRGIVDATVEKINEPINAPRCLRYQATGSNRRVAQDDQSLRRIHDNSIVLVCYSPYEVLAVAAEGGLLEEPWHEAVILDHVNILLLESALAAPQLIGEGVAGPEGVLARVLRIVRHGAAAADAAATDRRSIDVDGASRATRAAPRRG